jgi:hypothetical protein
VEFVEFEVFEKGEVFDRLLRWGIVVFWWFARVRKYFVRNEKFRSEISRFQEGVRVLKKVLKL